ncbi:MAG: hypothetical protein R2932_23600 [Caldilineaceae bacterium]
MYVVVNEDGKYFTNDWRSFEGEHCFLWTSHKQLAKQYDKRGWATNAARRVGGRATTIGKRLTVGQ